MSDDTQPLPTQLVDPPGDTRQTIHSMWFYMVIMAILPVLTWPLSFVAGNPTPTVILAVLTTAVAFAMCLLRYWRGSVLEAEAAERYSKQFNPSHMFIASNRIGKRLHKDEVLIWETRLHPISILFFWHDKLLKAKKRKVKRPFYALLLTYLTDMAVVALWLGGLVGLVILVDHVGFNPFAWIGLAILAGGLLLALGYPTLRWYCDHYALTNGRFIAVLGVIRTDTPSMPRKALTDFSVRTSILAHVLAWLRLNYLPFGTWKVETAGQWQGLETVHYIPAADLMAATYPPGLT